MFNSAHLADNNFTPGIRFYKIDVFVSVFFCLFFCFVFFSTIIVPRMKAACFVSFFLHKFCIYVLLLATKIFQLVRLYSTLDSHFIVLL